MNETQLVFQLKRGLAVAEHHVKQLEQQIIAQQISMGWSLNTCCGWAFQIGMGGPELTDAEHAAAINYFWDLNDNEKALIRDRLDVVEAVREVMGSRKAAPEVKSNVVSLR